MFNHKIEAHSFSPNSAEIRDKEKGFRCYFDFTQPFEIQRKKNPISSKIKDKGRRDESMGFEGLEDAKKGLKMMMNSDGMRRKGSGERECRFRRRGREGKWKLGKMGF